MCGISGLVSSQHEVAEGKACVEAMVAAQRHRGPDDEGVCTLHNGFFTINLGHNRLSIIDISKDGHQPMCDRETGNVIVFNGEIYNFKELKHMLIAKGYQFVSKTDTEVILKAYSEWGVDCLNYFEGIFAFAIWDKKREQLVLARDQMGVKPLYYYYDEKTFYFASEVRTLLKGGVPAKISQKGLNSLLFSGSVQEPFTLIEGVKSLSPGAYAIVDKQLRFNENLYWTPDFSKASACHYEQAEEATSQLLKKAVNLQLVSDVPLGAFLSGGIDSSAIVALMRQVNPDADIHTFSIVFEDPKYDERQYARMVAKRNRTSHTELLMTGEMIKKSLPEMIKAYDQPSMDGMNSWCVSKLVKDSDITVVLSGVGGDELFVGYGNFSKARKIYQYSNALSKLPGMMGHAIEHFAWNEKMRKVGETVSFDYDPYFIARRVFSDKQYSLLIKEDNQVSPYYWLHEAYDRITSQTYTDEISRLSWYVQRSYMLSTLLRDTDQMSMAHSLEIRVPLIDHKLVEYVTSLSQDIKIDLQTPKHLLVKAAGEGIPNECIHRRKQGFEFPFDSFIKNELKNEIEAFFFGESHEVFKKRGLEKMWKQYQEGNIAWSRVLLLYITNQWLNNNHVSA